jgi:hypothetical protein
MLSCASLLMAPPHLYGMVMASLELFRAMTEQDDAKSTSTPTRPLFGRALVRGCRRLSGFNSAPFGEDVQKLTNKRQRGHEGVISEYGSVQIFKARISADQMSG